MPSISVPPSSPSPVGFSEQLTALRRSRGLSLRQLARLAGLSHDSLGAWERGERLPRLPELEAALRALGLSQSERLSLFTLVPAPRALQHARRGETEQVEWARLAGPIPGGGDLLRAMRLRRGLTQVETAKAVGVSQGRLAEWERCGDWPDAGRLHSLCLTLGAHIEEVAALTAGIRLDTGANDPEDVDPAAWEERIVQTWKNIHPLRDLRLVALEARLWPLAARSERARPLLMAAYACHARSLTDSGRFASAPAYAARSLDLAHAGYGGGEQWAWAAIATGIALRKSGEPAAPGEAAVRRRGRRAAGFLRTWERAVRLPANLAWLRADLAQALRQAGEVEVAVALSEEACRLALEAENPYEVPNRRHDLALLLAGLGRFGPALEALDGARLLGLLQGDTRIVHLMLEAECLLGLGRRAEAQDRAGEAVEGCAPPHLAFLRPRAEALARQF